MNILPISGINFSAICTGDYQKIKNISVKNGLSMEKAKLIDDKIQSYFPEDTFTLDFHFFNLRKDENSEVTVRLRNENNEVIDKLSRVMVTKRNKEERTEQQNFKNIFERTANMVKKLKEQYDIKEQEKAKRREMYARIAKRQEIEPQNAQKVADVPKQFVIPDTLEKIKNISVEAGYLETKANTLMNIIKNLFKNKKFEGKRMVMQLSYDKDNDGKMKYWLLHNVSAIDSRYDAQRAISEAARDPISDGNTDADKRNLLERTYKVLKDAYYY